MQLGSTTELTKFADMILIADSGSSKTDWAFLSGDTSIQVRTGGINPAVMDEEAIEALMHEELLLHVPEAISEVWFYGAGCVPGSASEKMLKVLGHLFEDAMIHVYSDLVGAAKSVLGDQEGIVAILGTGSNSGLCVNDVITQNIPPLGYILGDEGSGTWFGKRLIADHLRGIMPAHLSDVFERRYAYLLKAWIPKIYGHNRPNRTLASVAPFLKEYRSENYAHDLLLEGFTAFVKRNLMLYPNWKDHKIAFVGSLAEVYREELEEVIETLGARLWKVEQEPMEGLVKYHIAKIGESK